MTAIHPQYHQSVILQIWDVLQVYRLIYEVVPMQAILVHGTVVLLLAHATILQILAVVVPTHVHHE
jgi:hypothetical protein